MDVSESIKTGTAHNLLFESFGNVGFLFATNEHVNFADVGETVEHFFE
jgi:hypothetical protein